MLEVMSEMGIHFPFLLIYSPIHSMHCNKFHLFLSGESIKTKGKKNLEIGVLKMPKNLCAQESHKGNSCGLLVRKILSALRLKNPWEKNLMISKVLNS